MGPKKKWHMHSRPKRSRDDQQQANSDGVGGNSGRGNDEASHQQQQQQPSKRARVSAMSLGSVKGHQAVVGTCDVRNVRQATAELVDLLNAFADDLHSEAGGQEEEEGEEQKKGATDAAPPAPEVAAPGQEDRASDSNNGTPAAAAAADDRTKPASVSAPPPSVTPTSTTASEKKPPLSVEEMVRQEADALRSGTAESHRFKSVNTSVRGVVMVCVMDPKIDVLKLVDAVFEGIRSTRKRRCRFLERVTPIQVTAFSELEAFKSAAEPIVGAALPQVAEGVPPIDEAGKVAPPKSNAAAANTGSAGISGSEASPPTKEEASGEGQTAAAVDAGKTTTAPAADAAVAEQAPKCASASASNASSFNPEGAPTTPGAPGSPALPCDPDAGDGDAAGDAATAAGNGGGDDAGKVKQTAGTTAAAAAAAEVVAAGTREGGSEGSGEVAAKKTCEKRWKFRVDVRRRNSGLKRLDLINAVADSVGKGHTVSMSSPEVTIAIEAVKSVVGASVLFNYALNHEYSISRLQDAVCGAFLNDE